MNRILQYISMIIFVFALLPSYAGTVINNAGIQIPDPKGHTLVKKDSDSFAALSSAARKSDAAFLPTRKKDKSYTAKEIKEVGFFHVRTMNIPGVDSLQEWNEFKKLLANQWKQKVKANHQIPENKRRATQLDVMHNSARLLLYGYEAKLPKHSAYRKLVGIQGSVFVNNRVLLIEGVRPVHNKKTLKMLLEATEEWGLNIVRANSIK